MKELLEQVASLIADYRAGELPAPDADHVGRWIAQFDQEEREPVLRELLHVWRQIYISKNVAEQFLAREVENASLTKGDHSAFWRSTKFLAIQQRGHSQKEMLELMAPALKAKTGLELAECGGDETFIYIDDVLFTGGRIKTDMLAWIASEAPPRATVIVLVIALHTFGCWRLEEDIKAAAKAAGKSITLQIFRLVALENRKFRKDSSDVLWPTTLPPGAEAYGQGNTGHIARTPGGTSQIFSSEEGRHTLEQAFVKAGLKIRSFSQNPRPILRPLGFGHFGVGFGSIFLSWRNCPNNAPLALWWGDPSKPGWHPFSKWYPLVPRKTYGEDDV